MIVTASIASPVHSSTVTFQYDALNRLIRASYDTETSIAYTYDAAGNRLSEIVDTAAPAIAIENPTAVVSFTTEAASIDLAGIASDDTAVVEVTWTNDRGGSGVAAGTNDWSILAIPLQLGDNVLTVTARDAVDRMSSDVLTVTFDPSTPTSTPEATPTPIETPTDTPLVTPTDTPEGEDTASPTSTPVTTSTPTASATVVACVLDVDGSGPPPNPATDVVYFARHTLALVPVPANFRTIDPTIPPDAEIAARVVAMGMSADVDANGVVDVATDVVYIARHLLALPPVPANFRVLDPSIPPDTEIAARVDGLCPMP